MENISGLESRYTNIVWKMSERRLGTSAKVSRVRGTREMLIRMSSMVETT